MREQVNILYLGIRGFGLARELNNRKNIKSKTKIINKNEIISFYNVYYIYTENVDIKFINISRTNKDVFTDIITSELLQDDKLIIIGDNERKKLINNIINYNIHKFKYIDVTISDDVIKRSEGLDKKVIAKELITFYLKKIMDDNINLMGSVYLSNSSPIDECGYGVTKVLSEYADLFKQKEVCINVITRDLLRMDLLSYIIDPLQEYVNEEANVVTKNILANHSENFSVLILGVR